MSETDYRIAANEKVAALTELEAKILNRAFKELLEKDFTYEFIYTLLDEKGAKLLAQNKNLIFYRPLQEEILLKIEVRQEEEQRRQTIRTGLQAAWEAAQDMDVEVYYIPPALPKKRKLTFSLNSLDITKEGF